MSEYTVLRKECFIPHLGNSFLGLTLSLQRNTKVINSEKLSRSDFDKFDKRPVSTVCDVYD